VLEADLAGEYDARTYYRESRDVCKNAGDYVSMELFEDLLEDEEGHINFLESQIGLLDKIGDQLYSQLQAEAADEAK
jgi:bacterioferritin